MKKILALYLPQYHSIPENDMWWGKGYTEWTAVKKAKPFFKKQIQPKIPLNDNYYDLSDTNATTWAWQACLAKKYGIYGFAVYHYWFGNGKKLLEKPLEILLKHKEIDINYSIVWANETWTKAWYNLESKVLIEQEYGDQKDWTDHFNYFVQFFKDERYIKVNGCPVIHIYKTGYIEQLDEMICLWRKLSVENGFPGLYVVSGNTIQGIEPRDKNIDAYYNFEPGFSQKYNSSIIDKLLRGLNIFLRKNRNKLFRQKRLERIENISAVYRAIAKRRKYKKQTFYGTFPMWDNTPRRGYMGSYFQGASPQKFYESLKDIYVRSNQDSFIYVNAWNEWGEGCYLEPDTNNGFAYLECVKRVIEEE